MRIRKVVINGDDFGLSPSVNQAVIQAHEQGILTSTSLMVSGKAWAEAVALAKTHPNLGVGLHLVLVCGQSVLPPEQIPHLVDRQGNFPDDPVKAGLNYQLNPAARAELKQEIRAQLEKFQQTGLSLSHVDGHLHLHTHPIILGILKDLAAEFGIKIIRLPSEELRFTLTIDRSNLPIKIIHSQIFRQLRRYGERLLHSQGIMTLDKVYGLLATGKMSEGYLQQLIPQIQANVIEIYSHPDCSEETNPTGPLELQALLSPSIRDRLQDCGFELVNFHQLAQRPTNT
ncbi:MAG: hopanoid biosynthesis-associated protein HpnK [Snowella sp.]|nr:hopanoid biosynthesis-associated protein HpnK [Snowella sp.]